MAAELSLAPLTVAGSPTLRPKPSREVKSPMPSRLAPLDTTVETPARSPNGPNVFNPPFSPIVGPSIPKLAADELDTYDGREAAKLFNQGQAYTYDDVILLPGTGWGGRGTGKGRPRAIMSACDVSRAAPTLAFWIARPH